MRGMIVFALLLGGCGPNNEANCEEICELAAECSGQDYTAQDVGNCEDECLDMVGSSDKCADVMDEFVVCVDGRCGREECASEADDVYDECE